MSKYPVSEKTARHFASQNLRAAQSEEHEAFLRGRRIGEWHLSVEGDLVWTYRP